MNATRSLRSGLAAACVLVAAIAPAASGQDSNAQAPHARTVPPPTAHSQPGRSAAPIDWPSFLARQDLVWNHLPGSWGESPFIGNGRLGATIDTSAGAFGWTINRTDVTHGEERYPIGRVELHTAGTLTGGNARLALWDAEASGVVRTSAGEVRWRSFTATRPSVIAIVLDCRGGERACALDWVPAEARPPRKVYQKAAFAPADLHPAAVVSRQGGAITSVQEFLGGGAHAESIVRAPGRGSTRVYYVSIGFAPGGPRPGRGDGDTRPDTAAGAAPGRVPSPVLRTDPAAGAAALAEARAATATASAQGLTRVTTHHRAWWHAYYPRSFLSFPDPRLEAYYWIQVYKLGSAMRPDGPILDLAGPWFNRTPWPAIWWNLNIQLTYSPLFTANRLDLAESLFRNLDRHTQALIDNVPQALRGEAAAIGRSSGDDLVRKVDLAHAESPASHEMGDLPWTMYYYWLYYRDTMDDRLLRDRVYPLLARSIGNYLPYIQKGEDGRWHLPPTHSPELATVADANYDLALLRWGLQTLVASAEHLKLSDPRLPRWRDVLANLAPFPADSNGLMVGRDRPWKESHRHYSHLLAIFPLGLITPETPEGRTLIARSLRTWEGDPALFRGYSFTGAASMYARLGWGDTALDRLHRYLDFPKYMQPNTFYAEAGPVIETPLSAATSIQDLVLQSWGGTLRVFPAVPTAWRDVAFDRFRGEGAFLVSAVRHEGRTAWVRVESLAGEPCVVSVPDWTVAVVRARGGAGVPPALHAEGGGRFTVALARGSWVVLAPDSSSALPPLMPVPEPPGAANPFPEHPRTTAAR